VDLAIGLFKVSAVAESTTKSTLQCLIQTQKAACYASPIKVLLIS
jgi:hypothetical protein